MNMITKSKFIFIQENETLEKVLDIFSKEVDKNGFSEQLKFIFNKQNNNYVGYYLFLTDDQIYKVFVLPKIIDNDLSEQEKVRQFLNYLSEFYRLDGDSDKKIASPIEIAFEHFIKDGSAQKDLDSFLYHKYSYLLESIKLFFKSHQNKVTRNVAYSSQSIRHKLDLGKNLTALDKSKIYQLKSEQYIYSDIARIAYGAIRLFMTSKSVLIENESKRLEIENKCRTINSFLLQKFKLDRSFTLKTQGLLSLATYRYFRKKNHQKHLYRTILMLFGLERFFDDEEADIHYEQKGEYVFFRPENLYEKYVKDWLENNENYESIKYKASESYFTIVDHGSRKLSTVSEPDITAGKPNEICVIDAKWKILKSPKADVSPISAADLLKLERDFKVHGATKAILAYCKVKEETMKGTMKTIYNSSEFRFEIIEIPMILGI